MSNDQQRAEDSRADDGVDHAHLVTRLASLRRDASSTVCQADRERHTLPWEIERRRFVTVDEAARLKSLSRDTFVRRYAHLIHRLSPRRRGARLGDVLGED